MSNSAGPEPAEIFRSQTSAQQQLRQRLRTFSANSVLSGSVRDVSLRLTVLATGSETSRTLEALVDTGSEVNLVRRGLFPPDCFQPSARPVSLTTANSQRMSGGVQEALLTLEFAGRDKESARPVHVSTPSLLYEADISQDIILSYAWLAERGFDVCPKRHGLQGIADGRIVWLPGLSKTRQTHSWDEENHVTAQIELLTVTGGGPKRALDLFSGLGSATKVLRAHGYQVVSLDSDPRMGADICTDILEWDPTGYPPGYFDIIVACPPCTEYSAALTTRARDLERADQIVRKALEIIHYFAPTKWVLENPAGGLLGRRGILDGYPTITCDQCQFSDFGYKKPTQFWGSPHLSRLVDVVCDHIKCPNLRPGERRHRIRQGGPGGE